MPRFLRAMTRAPVFRDKRTASAVLLAALLSVPAAAGAQSLCQGKSLTLGRL